MNKIIYTLIFILSLSFLNNEAKAQSSDIDKCSLVSGAVNVTTLAAATDKTCDTTGATKLSFQLHNLGFCTSAPNIKFQTDEELYSFLYEEFPMEIFGHSQSVEYSTFNDFNEIYLNLRDNHDVLIVSDEIGKSKPASLFFLSKFGCLVEKVKFYSNSTINSMWDEIDVLLTSNPALLLEHPEDKIVIKYQTDYNKHIKSDNSITTLKELEFGLTKLI